jgi:hydroxymethylpyrimidine pyrophosphatase-like HAD family hydrolase
MNKAIYVGFDRDGTLEAPGHIIPTCLKRQFRSLQKMGIKLFLASGKSYSFLSKNARELELDPWMICSENGGHIVIPSENIEVIFEENHDLFFFKEKINTVSLPVYQEEQKLSIWSKKFGANLLEAEAKIKKLILENNWNLVVYNHSDIDGSLDVVPNGINKVNLLKYIPENSMIYFIGDAENDLSLLAHEKVISCSVSNATTTVKAVVKNKNGHIATKPVGEGVSEILKHLFNV